MKLKKVVAIICLVSLSFYLAPVLPAKAANLDNAMIRLSRMTASQTGVTALVIIDPTTGITGDAIHVTFATGYDVDTLTITQVADNTEYVGGVEVAPLPSINTTPTIVGQRVEVAFTGAIANGTYYGFYINGIGTPAAGQYVNTIQTYDSGAYVDAAKVATRQITNDQIVITATVPPTFNMTLEANVDNFTTDLDPGGVVSTSGITVTFETNAINGWSAWLQSANTSLDSVTTGEEIETFGSATDGAPTAINAAGTDEYYQLDVTNPTPLMTGGASVTAVTVAAEYDGDGTHGGTFSTALQEIAYGNGTTNGDTIDLYARAVPTAIRAAATDYTDTWTVVGAANF